MQNDSDIRDVDPEASEGNGQRILYDPKCSRSVERAAKRIQAELGLPYCPTLTSPTMGSWRRLLPWLRGRLHRAA